MFKKEGYNSGFWGLLSRDGLLYIPVVNLLFLSFNLCYLLHLGPFSGGMPKSWQISNLLQRLLPSRIVSTRPCIPCVTFRISTLFATFPTPSWNNLTQWCNINGIAFDPERIQPTNKIRPHETMLSWKAFIVLNVVYTISKGYCSNLPTIWTVISKTPARCFSFRHMLKILPTWVLSALKDW